MQTVNKTWLILDCGFLCHRAFTSLGELEHKAVKTGVVYGFLNEIRNLQEQFDTRNLVFCFDYGRVNVRTGILPGYKFKRRTKQLDPQETNAKKEMVRQVHLLRRRYLPQMGYRNVLSQKGYEADDMMASVVKTLPKGDEAILITNDGDLYQLIGPHCRYYNLPRRKMLTHHTFEKEFGVPACDWWKVLAIAGCNTDEVPGIPGVGKASAISYLQGKLPAHYKKFQSIESEEGRSIIKRNRKLVKLPFPTTNRFELRDDEIDSAATLALYEELGFTSFRGVRRSRKGFLNV